MKGIISTIFCVLVGMVLMYLMLAHHTVTTENGRIYVPKKQLTLKDSFVNVTEWKTADLKEHPEVVEALVKNGHKEVIAHLVVEDAKSGLQKLLDKVIWK